MWSVGSVKTFGGSEQEIPVPPDKTSLTSAYESMDGFSFGLGSLWVAGDALGRTVWRIDPRTHAVVATIPLPFVPAGLTVGEGAVWVTSLLGDTVARIDPARTGSSGRCASGAEREAPTGYGSLWVANSVDGTVSRIDPKTNRIVATIPVGHEPGDIAVGPEGVWVTTAASKPVDAAGRTIAIGVLSDCKGRYSFSRAPRSPGPISPCSSGAAGAAGLF